MQRILVRLAFTASLVVIASRAVAAQELMSLQQPIQATIFVRQATQVGAPESYISVAGTITELTPTYLIINVSGAEQLYARDAVRHIRLHEGVSNSRDLMLISYWKRDQPLTVQLVQALPVVGQGLGFLNRKSPETATLLSSLLLLVTILWGLYKIHELVVVARDSRRLNRIKLHLDIAKARYEAMALGENASPQEQFALNVLEFPLLDEYYSAGVAKTPVTQPRFGRIRAFARNLLLSEMERAERLRICREEWKIRLERGVVHTKRIFRRRVYLRRLALVLLCIYGPPILIFSFFAIPLAVQEGESVYAYFALPYMIVGFLCTYGAMRVHVGSRILRRAYEETIHDFFETGVSGITTNQSPATGGAGV